MASRLENRVSRQHAVHQQQALKIPVHGLRLVLERLGIVRPTDRAQRSCESAERLVMQSHRPGAAHMFTQHGVRGLQRIVPVPVTVRGQGGPGNESLLYQCERALHVLPHRRLFAGLRAPRVEKADRLIQHGAIARGEQILSQHHERPEHDIAMRVAGSDATLALEKHEPLRPIAVRVLLLHDSQQQVAYGRGTILREQQFHRSLADVARAPTAAGVLFQAPRRKVVHQGVMGEPRDDVGHISQALGHGAGAGRSHSQLRDQADSRVGEQRRLRLLRHEMAANRQSNSGGGAVTMHRKGCWRECWSRNSNSSPPTC